MPRASSSPAADVRALVDLDRGLIDPRIFADEDIFQLELRRVFGRCWLFLGHESHLRDAGDFVVTQMGVDPVLLVRSEDGTLGAYLNYCRHRGMKVCRAEGGNARAFTCPYHGWTYGLDGALTAVPYLDEAYRGGLDPAQWGLVPVGQVDSYKGLVFGCFDATAPPLADYLGEIAWYLDAMVDRLDGGTEAIGPHKWRIKVNWKVAAEQFVGDTYHAGMTHASLADVVVPGAGLDGFLTAPGRQYASPNGHGISFASGAFRFFTDVVMRDPAVADFYAAAEPEMQRRLGSARVEGPTGGTMTLFPNFGTNGTFMRLWNPIDAHTIEVVGWALVDAAAPPAVKDSFRRASLRLDSPSGIVELDDTIIWETLGRTVGRAGTQSSRHPLHYGMGVGQAPRRDDPDFPGAVHPRFLGEGAIRNFYRRWVDLLVGDDLEDEP